ncbi:MAG TPA: tetratricopeptide repeat protein [Geminicoccaceae bacterium]
MSLRTSAAARAGTVAVTMIVTACAGAAATGEPEIGGLRLAVASEGRESYLGDYLAGNFARDIGEVAAAAGYFESALVGAPGNVELLEELFLLTVAAGEFESALRRARELVGARSEADEARLLLAAKAARDGDPAAARAQLEAVGERGIAALATPFLDAWAIFAGDATAVEDAILRLEQAEPLGPLNDYHESMLLHLAGRPAEGLKVLEGTVADNPRVPSRMAQAYAGMLAATGARDRAIAFLEEQVADATEQPHIARSLEVLRSGSEPLLPFADAVGGMADALLGIAEALHQERGGQRAIFYARAAQFLDPELDDAALLVGDIMAEQDNQEAAIAAYQRIGEGSPLHYAGQLRIARSLYQLERHEEAFDTLEELGRKVPDRVDALVQLGDLLRREEEYERAERAYSRAIERTGGAVGPEDWSLFYTRGITRERTDRWPEAEADFLKALELQPEQPFVLNYLGYSWVDMGMHLDRAKGMLNRAVELRPNDGFIVDSLGWVHYRLGDYRDAVEQLERAVELEPGDPVINDHLGDAYWRVGRTREARYQWERALTLEPEEDVEEAIRKKLEDGLPARDGTEIDPT